MPVDFQQDEEVLNVSRSLLAVVVAQVAKDDICGFHVEDFLENLAYHDVQGYNFKVDGLIVVTHEKLAVFTGQFELGSALSDGL